MGLVFLKHRRVIIKCFIAILTVFTVSFLCTQNTFANCDGYGAYCECGADQCGAAWLNGSSYGNGSNGLSANMSANDENQVIKGYIHGAIVNITGGVPQECGSAPEGSCENTARHVYLVDSEWPGRYESDIDYGGWPVDDTGYGTKDWAEEHKVWWYDTNTVDDTEGGGGGWYNRGLLSYSAGGWSTNWEGGPMEISIRLNDFLQSGGVRVNDNTYEKDVYLFRCYHTYGGCNTDMTTIRITIKDTPEWHPEPGWRVNYQGKISFKNDDNSPLYRSGSKLNSNTWTDTSGWQPGYTLTSLYTPKESGQKLRSMYQLRWKCNNWMGQTRDGDYCGWKWHNLRHWGTDYVYAGQNGWTLQYWWWTQYDFSSDIGLNNRKTVESGEFRNVTYNDWGNVKEIAIPQRTRTADVPYGVGRHYQERLNYTSAGNHRKDVSEIVIWGVCCNKKRCWRCVKDNYVIVDSYDENAPKNATNAIDVSIYNPYNFKTTVSSSISGGNGSTVLGGSVATVNLSANIKSKTQQESTASAEVGFPYYTKVPDNTEGNVPTVVTAVAFTLKPDVDIDFSRLSSLLQDRTDVMKSSVQDNNLCSYFRGIFGSNVYSPTYDPEHPERDNACRTLFTEDHNSINKNIGETGWDTSTNNVVAQNGVSAITNEHKSYSIAVPDIDDGYKLCTAIGINHADSGDKDGGFRYAANHDDSFHLPVYNINDNWHISNISCRTIAKSPSFQTWGNVYTSGSVDTVTVKKIPNANLYTDVNSQNYLFGSWSETFSLANKQIHGLGTGASLGYNADGLGGFPVPNTQDKKTDYCNIVNMSIANGACNNNKSGNAGNVVVSNEDFLTKFVAHYATTTTDTLEHVTDTVNYYKASSNATINSTKALADNGYIQYGSGDNGVVHIEKRANGEGTTLIYQVDGDLTIDHNICTGYPSPNDQCRNGITDPNIFNFYNLDNQNTWYNAHTEKIPQIILIASGNVNITKNVTEIDAWIYSGKTIKTCSDGRLDDNSCNNPLVVHGPVFAKNVELHRTYGSWGPRFTSGPFSTDSRFFKSGAETPAEIFDLHPSTYQWIYQQTSLNDRNANVRYMRELAPRY